MTNRIVADNLTTTFGSYGSYECINEDTFRSIVNLQSFPTGKKQVLCTLTRINATHRVYQSSETECPDNFDETLSTTSSTVVSSTYTRLDDVM